MCDLNELVKYLAMAVVKHPEAVVVREVGGTSSIVFELSVAPDDMGRVIGRGGQVANAMRTVLRVVAAKEGKRVTLEIV